MKKIKSINELYIEYAFIILAIYIFAFLFALKYQIDLLILTTAFTIIVLSIMLLIAEKFIWGKGLPLKCKRSPYGFIEFHIGKLCNNKPTCLISNFIDITFIAIKEKKDILIDTWLISKESIIKYFGDSAEFLEPRFLQKLANKMNKRKFPEKAGNEDFRCIIHVTKLSNQQIVRLSEYKNKIIVAEKRREKSKKKKVV
ncbi:hypothetical protein [Desulfitobacterium metallireducens]|uniref:Uncharacterized protein n=1 Tax=Desulfitobacterium metallireducens DSM 15288 TaxID=871968 RepID=W0EH63_9FIRM|nr:hypothetical protein [Desulfitobacterium metallireducens]AHF08554.1 hypothetical protein DESME_08830 [Desulfitobacterium metallireducens DSM 15288]